MASKKKIAQTIAGSQEGKAAKAAGKLVPGGGGMVNAGVELGKKARRKAGLWLDYGDGPYPFTPEAYAAERAQAEDFKKGMESWKKAKKKAGIKD